MRVTGILAGVFVLVFFLGMVQAKDLHLVGGDDNGTYLGCVTCGADDAQSIWNSSGVYGSSYSKNSIWNEYSDFGSTYNSHSPFNPYGSSPPVVVDIDGGFYGYFTVSELFRSRIEYDVTDFITANFEQIQKGNPAEWYEIVRNAEINRYYGFVNGGYVFGQDADETYLGWIGNVSDAESIANRSGTHGNTVSPVSIWNSLGVFGSSLMSSTYSARNASQMAEPPIVYSLSGNSYKAICYITKCRSAIVSPSVDPDMVRFMMDKGEMSFSLTPPPPIEVSAALPVKKAGGGVSVAAHGNRITVAGIPQGERVFVYTLRGQLVHSAIVSETSIAFETNGARGVYLVKGNSLRGAFIEKVTIE